MRVPRVGVAGVTIVLPKGWHSIRQVVLPRTTPVNDPVSRIVVASAPIAFSSKGCNISIYSFPTTAVALVVVEWTRLSKSAHWALRPRRFNAVTLPIQAPPAIECFSGAGGSAEFADHGRHFGAYVLLGRHAPATLADRARAVLDSLKVTTSHR